VAVYFTSFQLSGAYAIDEQVVRNLFRATEKFLSFEPGLKVELEGSDHVDHPSVPELTDDVYIQSKRIVRLQIVSRRLDMIGKVSPDIPYRTVEVSIRSDSGALAPIDIIISGERELGMAFKQKLVDIINGKQLWYSLLFKGSWSSVTRMASLAVVGFMILVLFHQLTKIPVKADFVLWELIGATAILWLIAREMFPQVVFEIGKAKDRGIRALAWRRTVFGIVLAGVAVGILSTVLVEAFRG
jgi:hypothetical protein